MDFVYYYYYCQVQLHDLHDYLSFVVVNYPQIFLHQFHQKTVYHLNLKMIMIHEFFVVLLMIVNLNVN
ncbi:unnamed protein product [Schistosoma curassoni]|uniref:Uncharacterized protein n=1 Tax=Schistosoma curassoni TaxID=6186 RepID=A0A183L1X9_9TREM|nr:unnamed protein product [Schistosoma curassoni]